MTDDEKIKAVEAALGKPVDPGFTENVLRIRRNLLIAGLGSIFVAGAGLDIDPNHPIFGLKFVHLSNSELHLCLAAVTAYLLIHFVWCAVDAVLEWRVRVTGTRLAYVTAGTWGHEAADYPSDPRQSTLYTWWVTEARQIESVNAKVAQLQIKVEEWSTYFETEFKSRGPESNLHVAITVMNGVGESIRAIQQSVVRIQKMHETERVTVSLRRFDKWFGAFLRSQNLRWLSIELLLPIVIGGFGLVLMILNLK